MHGTPVMCGPHGLQGEPDHLFHNNGDGTFTDVSVKAGVSDKNAYYGFTAIFVDVNNDGKVDLLVANDSEPNYLYINKGDGTFDDQSYVSGFALNFDGREIASMGLAVGDYMNNGLVDLLVPISPTTTRRSIATTAKPALPKSPTRRASPNGRSLCGLGRRV
jgi:enediyne biosynthesis protein E4